MAGGALRLGNVTLRQTTSSVGCIVSRIETSAVAEKESTCGVK